VNLSLKEFKAYLGKDGKPAVKGIAVGYCVRGDTWENRLIGRELGGKRGREHAHSHIAREDGQYRGWICVREIENLGRKHRVSGTLMHELAHVLTISPKTGTGHGHDDTWRRAMARLGQFVAPAWQKHSRSRVAST
jgi:hypothetical protein